MSVFGFFVLLLALWWSGLSLATALVVFGAVGLTEILAAVGRAIMAAWKAK